MGILNITPDSFSDGGRHMVPNAALQQAAAMVRDGAAIFDVGGESTRPGAEPVSVQQELDRVIPVIERLHSEFSLPISIDTSKSEVMSEAVRAGAGFINDVNALRSEGAVQAAAECAVPVCLMHMQGEPRTMQKDPHYGDVVEDVIDFLKQRSDACIKGGIEKGNILVDPGFGFGKTLNHNLALLKHLEAFADLDHPLLIGISRKSMIGALLDGADVSQRLNGSLAAAVMAVERGAKIIRVHDVKETVEAVKVAWAVTALTEEST